jgi:hypothetical protein
MPYRLAFFFAFLAFGIIFFAAFLTAALADLTMISSSIS